jgi:hypothetical protein
MQRLRRHVTAAKNTHTQQHMNCWERRLLCDPVSYRSWSWSSSCGRRSVDQLVFGIGPPLGTHDQTFSCSSFFSVDNYVLLVPRAPSLTRGRVCSLQCSHSLVRAVTPNNHTLPSHLRLCSLSVASYDSQGLRWRYSNPPPHGVVQELSRRFFILGECILLHSNNEYYVVNRTH